MVNAQAVQVVHLNPKGTHIPAIQLWRATCDTEPEMIIRVHTHGCRLSPIGLPWDSEIDHFWFRKDLQWQFVDADSRIALEYKQRVNEIRTWNRK